MTAETSIYEYLKQESSPYIDKIAIWFYGKGITYRELFKRIDVVAEQLHTLGVKEKTVVTIRLPNCPQAIISIYAVAKIGGICNMVHAMLPIDKLKATMQFTKSNILITGNHVNDSQGIDFVEHLLYVDISKGMDVYHRLGYKLLNRNQCPSMGVQVEQTLESMSFSYPQPASIARDCSVYMHSSGSTGEPKTVMLSHSAQNTWVEMTKEYFSDCDITEQVCLSVLPYFHALGFQMDMHRVLSCGGTLILMAKWDGKKAVRLIKKYRINVMSGVPAMCRSLLKRKEFCGSRILQLRNCFIGGEKMEPELKRAMESRLCSESEPRVFEGYGLTETCSACAVSRKDHYHIDSCGYPAHGITFMVRHEDGLVDTIGYGELVVSGECLMMGYLNDPIATEKAFFEWNGKKMLRTGDYGRIDPGGLIYFSDRIKNTIIRKGNNIFPMEIESVIRNVAGVSEVCVIGLPDTVNYTQLVCACIISKQGEDVIEIKRQIENACKRVLPPVSIPSKYVFLQEFPKNQMGKIDRSSLEKLVS